MAPPPCRSIHGTASRLARIGRPERQVERAGPVLVGRLLERVLAAAADVVDQDVDPPEVLA